MLKTIDILNPDGSVTCPNCRMNISPLDDSEHYKILGARIGKSITVLIQCQCKQKIQIEIDGR